MPRRLLLMMLVMVVGHAHAIVIRHDTGYSQYVASETQFPAVFWLDQQAMRKVCVATLIHPQWALTAAHCVEETSIREGIDADGGFEVHIAGAAVDIDYVAMHPDYRNRYIAESSKTEVDLALLRLAKPLTLPRPMPLYRKQGELNQVVTLLGWGYFGIGTTGIEHDDGRFRRAHNVVSAATSRLRFVFDDPRLPDSNAVALEGMPGLGDSGGPALLKDDDDGWRLAGIAVGEIGAEGSHGAQGLYGAIGVYERISIHLDWIDAVLANPPSLAAPQNLAVQAESVSL